LQKQVSKNANAGSGVSSNLVSVMYRPVVIVIKNSNKASNQSSLVGDEVTV